jgi:hypothetical protein
VTGWALALLAMVGLAGGLTLKPAMARRVR